MPVLATGVDRFATGATGVLVQRHPVAIEVIPNAANLLIALAAGMRRQRR